MILADPGLIFPPAEGTDPLDYWNDVIAWGADRRLRLGRECYEWVFSTADADGWSLFDVEGCPPALRRLAIRAVSRLLAEPALPERLPDDLYEMSPDYVRHVDGGTIISIDLTSEWPEEVFALASRAGHWSDPCVAVTVRDSNTPLALSPTFHSDREQVVAARKALSGVRVTVVGGLRATQVADELAEMLGIGDSRLRWIEAEPGRQPNLDGLIMLRAQRDVVCCVLGAPGQLGLGHSGSEKAKRLAERAGVRLVIVRRPSEIRAALVDAFG